MRNYHYKNSRYANIFTGSKGLSFLDVIVGVGLLVLVFVAISGVFRLSINVIAGSKARVGALSVAQERVEFVRSLPYDNVGTVGGIPAGNIQQTEIVNLNKIAYTRRTLIQYVDDPKDGVGTADQNGIVADYKRVKTEVTWSIRDRQKSIALITNIVPKGIETVAGGGTLIINVFDSLGVAVLGANVHILNDSLNPVVSVNISTNADGKVTFPGSPAGSSYEITVTKSGYNSSKTYDTDTQNPNPNPAHLSVIKGNTTVASFQVDLISTKIVRTFFPIGENNFNDTFTSSANISQSASTTVSSGALKLADYGLGYEMNGYAYSTDISSPYLYAWEEASWNDNTPLGTSILYRLYYYSSSVLTLIPDVDIAGNSAGFSSSPVDISGLSISKYPIIQIAGFLQTTDASTTPQVLDWNIKYSAGPTPVSNIPFHIQGAKTIGSDSAGTPVYKYDKDLQTGSDGTITINNLEWDLYNVTIDDTSVGSDISESCNPQPRSINPASNVTTDIMLVPNTTNSLLVAVTDSSGVLLKDATVRLYRTTYNTIQTTSSCGQTFFSGLSKGTVLGGNPYSMDVSLAGYTPITFTDVDVNNVSNTTVVLQ